MKKLRGHFAIFWKYIGVNLQHLENLRTKMQHLENLRTKMQNLENYNNKENLKFLVYRCHLKFYKFNLNKILRKFTLF